MMARRPAFTQAFTGRWRIVELDRWDNDQPDFVEPTFIHFGTAGRLVGHLFIHNGDDPGLVAEPG